MKNTKRKKILAITWTILIVPVAMVALILLLVALFAKIPSFEALENPDNALTTQVISSDGVVMSTFYIQNRTYVTYDEISPNVINAAIAVEDSRFRSHSGIDIRGLFRVVFKTIVQGDSSQGGGSTITQQLAKTLYPRSDMDDISPLKYKLTMVWTKLKEWITAVKLERNYTKNEIISMYLNSIFFGSNAYGIKSAAETFFSKTPAELNAQEAALLVGMVNKPTRYNPVINPDKALERRNLVLGRMAQNGYISQQVCDSLQKTQIELDYQVVDHNSGLAPYFRDMLKRDMTAKEPRRSNYRYYEDYAADSVRWIVDDMYGWVNKVMKANGEKYNLDRDGLRIYTTIDSRMQKFAEDAMVEHLSKWVQPNFRWESSVIGLRNWPFAEDVEPQTISVLMGQARKWSDRYREQKNAGVSERRILEQFDVPVKMRLFAWNEKGYVDTVMTPNDSILYYKSMFRSGFIAMEPQTGHVKAYVGGPNYRHFKYDNVRQGKRQVGSTVKPFLYTLAMQEGMTPCDRVVNIPQSFIAGDGTTWTPRSTDRDEWIGKTVTLKWGLTHSSNNISAYLMKQFGPAAMIDMMHKMGVYSHIDEVYSICVGSADVSLYEMVAAYNALPSKGVYIYPQFVTRIEDKDGNVISEFATKRREAISENTAYLMVNLMEGVVNNGTGSKLRWQYNFKGQIAGKTGTTNDNSDGWFIGYTPSITAGVWVGGEDRQVHFKAIGLGGGANIALPIWARWMRKCVNAGLLDDNGVFKAPVGMNLDLNCTGGDIDTGELPQEEGADGEIAEPREQAEEEEFF